MRNPSDRRRASLDWLTPNGLKAMLDGDRAAARTAPTALRFEVARTLRTMLDLLLGGTYPARSGSGLAEA